MREDKDVDSPSPAVMADLARAMAAAGAAARRPAMPQAPEPFAQRQARLAAEAERLRASIAADTTMRRYPSLRMIMAITSATVGIPINAIVSPRRHIPTARARHIFFFVARELTAASYPQIGRYCGDRDHSTVMHGVQKVDSNRSLFEPELSQILKIIDECKS